MWMAAPYRALSRILKVGNVPAGTSRSLGRPHSVASHTDPGLMTVLPAQVLWLIAQQLSQPGFFRRGQIHGLWRKRASPPAADNNEQGNSKQHGYGRRPP